MNRKFFFLFVIFYLLFNLYPVYAGEDAFIDMFSPQDTVKGVRQVAVRFSEQIVPFGDPRLVEPFEINCPEKGKARWADGKNWIYDFDRDLPAGIVCEFILNPDLKTLSGKEITGKQKFSFSTGGPAVRLTYPREGTRYIDENQIFILVLDAEPDEDSILSNVFFSIEGVTENVGVRIVKDDERKQILNAAGFKSYAVIKSKLRFIIKSKKAAPEDIPPMIVIQCKQRFPNNTEVSLIWGKGVKSLSGVETTEDQILPFETRSPFTARFSCERERKGANCIPFLPMRLEFSTPVSQEFAGKVVLKGTDGKVFKSLIAYDDEKGEKEREDEKQKPGFVNEVIFKGPFPENAWFSIEIPKDIKDDAGRSLMNLDKFPLAVRTDSYPPLAKFSSRFGIIELKGDAALPVTLRNLEQEVKTKMFEIGEKKDGVVDKAKEGILDKAVEVGEAVTSILPDFIKGKGTDIVEGLKGRLQKIKADKEERIIEWLRKVAVAGRQKSVLKDADDVKDFSIPKPGGAKAFEVVGIPLKKPGFYVVEMESRILGKSLLGEQKNFLGIVQQKPMYVPTAALVTNLSAHFKKGKESSLVWVTTLDKAEPVTNASVTIRDCSGKIVWSGKTDINGIAYIKEQLPSEDKLPYCKSEPSQIEKGDYYDYHPYDAISELNSGFFIFAKTSDDMTFVHSSWNKGIEPWRYNLPSASYRGPIIAHTIFDRTLLKAGETVNMKHVIRRHVMSGIKFVYPANLPETITIEHQGSGQKYEFPLKWDDSGIAESTWKIPQDAKLGTYEVSLKKKAKKIMKGDPAREYEREKRWNSGSFRVEEFRIPLMKGIIQMPKEPAVNVSEINVDLLVTYLSGGGASNAPVKLRSHVQPKNVNFEDYENFVFANGEVKEGIIRRSYAEYDEEAERETEQKSPKVQSSILMLDKSGALRAKITNLPKKSTPQDVLAELEFKDPNGEIQTVSTRIPLWNSRVLVGIKPDSWAASKESFKFHVAAVDLSGKPAANIDVKVDMFQAKIYSHRKRLVGGFYSYEHATETKRLGSLCEGKTDLKGLLICDVKSPVSGNVILQAKAKDNEGNITIANRSVWIAGKDEWWFDVSDNDRIDLLPEKKKYEPGDIAKFQVRMPFREATALVTIEREGVMEAFIKRLSGKNPVLEIPVKGNYAPNVFVSALCIRGRIEDIKPTALIDLGKPAYKLGIAGINVGWKAFELNVKVTPEKNVYKIREKALVRIKVKRANGMVMPKGMEVAVAAVDEGLLELMPNNSWKILEAMMGRRGYEVATSTAQTQVVGKRHYGLKAIPHGGGGGSQTIRELFDTLLLWKGRVALDEKGEASVEIPLNDSLTAFRIVAVATGGSGLFGTGQASIRSTQDLMILSGMPQLVREGDKFRAGFTVRNSSNKKMDIEVSAAANIENRMNRLTETLEPGEAKDIGWDIKVPSGIESINWEVVAKEKNGDNIDRLKVKQKVVAAVPVRTYQATITQIKDSFTLSIEKPEDAIPGKGGIAVSLKPKLSDGLSGVILYMKQYPYTCMEQKISRAVALRDKAMWEKIISEMPSHLDSDGLVKYFPSMWLGDDTLTSYIYSIAHEAGWEIPSNIKKRMEAGLRGFIEGKIIRYSSLPTADLSIRKMAALEALSRSGHAEPELLDSISVEPNLWPTSAVLDWTNVLMRVKEIPNRDKGLKEAEQIIRSRLNFQGTTMGFSTEKTDYLWWLMVSGDVNAIKSVLTFLNFNSWNEDMPRLVRGAISRQNKGAWNTTTANAWGVLAMKKFSEKFESVPVSGITNTIVEKQSKTFDWNKSPNGESTIFGWPADKENLNISHQGSGKPWATIQSLAAIPLKEAFSSGYKIKKTLTAIEQKEEGKWSRGDVIRVKLEIAAQADMTWVVVSDPIPAGSSILGTGLGRDSDLLKKGEKNIGWVWPAFEERSFEAFRAYYRYVPKGKWSVEYTIRLNNEGIFNLPETRVEALYSPEMFGEMPNKKMEVEP